MIFSDCSSEIHLLVFIVFLFCCQKKDTTATSGDSNSEALQNLSAYGALQKQIYREEAIGRMLDAEIIASENRQVHRAGQVYHSGQ